MNEDCILKRYTSGPITRQLLAFAWPFMLSNLLQTAYNLTDMIVVGQYVGSAGLSAVSIGADIMHMFLFIGFGFCNAGQVLISQLVGVDDRRGVARMVGTTFTFLLLLSLVVTAIGLWGMGLWLRLLNVPTEAAEYARQYTVCCTAGLFFMFGYQTVSAVLRGLGDSKRPMLFVAVAAVINILLDIVLVRAGMGPLGAAVATVAAQAVSFLSSLVYLWRRRDRLGFEFRPADLIPDRRRLGLLLNLGFPMMLQSCAISFSALFVTSNINTYGVTVSAVTGVGAKLSTIANIVSQALNQAGATIIGQNFAARKFDRVKRTFWTAAVAAMSFAALLSVIIIVFPEQVFSLFNREPEVLALCHSYVIIAVLNFFGCATRSPSGALCNGMGFPVMNFILGMFDGVVMRIGLTLLLGRVFSMGISGFWLGSALAGYAFILVMLPYFLSGKWEKRAPPVAKEVQA